MTWEWVFLITASMLVGAGVTIYWLEYGLKKSKDVEVKDLRLALEKVIDVQNKITKDMSDISATAEETKKLLSQTNLAVGFVGRTRGAR